MLAAATELLERRMSMSRLWPLWDCGFLTARQQALWQASAAHGCVPCHLAEVLQGHLDSGRIGKHEVKNCEEMWRNVKNRCQWLSVTVSELRHAVSAVPRACFLIPWVTEWSCTELEGSWGTSSPTSPPSHWGYNIYAWQCHGRSKVVQSWKNDSQTTRVERVESWESIVTHGDIVMSSAFGPTLVILTLAYGHLPTTHPLIHGAWDFRCKLGSKPQVWAAVTTQRQQRQELNFNTQGRAEAEKGGTHRLIQIAAECCYRNRIRLDTIGSKSFASREWGQALRFESRFLRHGRHPEQVLMLRVQLNS